MNGFSLDSIFKRIGNDWQSFLMMGVGPFLVGLVTMVIAFVLAFALLGPSIVNLIRADMMGGVDPGDAMGMLGSFFGFMAVAMALGIVAGGLSYGGLFGTLGAYRRGEQITLGLFWSYATQNFGKMILLGIIMVAAVVVSMVILIIPVLGWIAYPVVQATIALCLGVYPAYLIAAEGYGVSDAVSLGFRAITGRFVDALLGGLVFLGFSIAVGMVAIVPIVGWLAVALLGTPIITYIGIEWFETKIRPHLVS